ncbi:HNH endonuclease signature motif containing protein [Williamsia phyllosphaerae]|uniref:HNH endonuclease n=1 Tax=Williamsia phyllosphaerae TaxID=885042 RepID=A0ABQ1V1U5_9NOCA|nr:HNH endonuclease signature motif containing protein [Williamsia phyllosphaerae]GGF34783.1 HNH endonuclease [Williamsia phyllosphaerae]
MSRGTLIEIANELVDQYGCRDTVVDDSDDRIVEAIRGAVALRAVADDLLARLTSQAERVGVAKHAGMSLRELLSANGVAPALASRLIRLGRAIHVLPRVARHSRDATLSAEHLDAVARGVEHVVRRTGEPVDSETIAALEVDLVGQAVAGTTPAAIVERARTAAIELTECEPGGDEPDRVPPAEDAALNELGWHTTDDGRLHGTFEFDALTGERLITALDTASRPRPEPDGSEDARPAARRRADAFGQLLECGTRGLSPDALSGPPHTEILVTIPLDIDIATTAVNASTASLTWMGPITELSAKLLACDARLAGVGVDLNGAPVSVAAPEPRLFTGAARKVVLLRDRCCIKCGAPASWCDVHHIVHHADGGPTTVDNGCLLCRSCHTAVHHDGWQVIMGADRHPWLMPPASVDPRRRPLPAYNRRTMRIDDPIAA